MSQLENSITINGATVHAVAHTPWGAYYSLEPPPGYEYQCPRCKTKNQVLPHHWYEVTPHGDMEVPLCTPKARLVATCHGDVPSFFKGYDICYYRADEQEFRVRKRDYIIL